MARSINLNTLPVALPTAPAQPLKLLARVVAAITLTFEAIGEGLAASRRYDALRGQGVPHAVAVTQIFPK